MSQNRNETLKKSVTKQSGAWSHVRNNLSPTAAIITFESCREYCNIWRHQPGGGQSFRDNFFKLAAFSYPMELVNFPLAISSVIGHTSISHASLLLVRRGRIELTGTIEANFTRRTSYFHSGIRHSSKSNLELSMLSFQCSHMN